MGPVTVFYVVPVDGDELSNPNQFALTPSHSDGHLRLRDVVAGFPLEGRYHFRFKNRWRGDDGYIWIDLVDPEGRVPSFDKSFFAKVSRLSADRARVAAPRSSPKLSSSQPKSAKRATSASTSTVAPQEPALQKTASSGDLLDLLASDVKSPQRSRRLSKRKSNDFLHIHADLLARRPSAEISAASAAGGNSTPAEGNLLSPERGTGDAGAPPSPPPGERRVSGTTQFMRDMLGGL
jgi:hypothetical protein